MCSANAMICCCNVTFPTIWQFAIIVVLTLSPFSTGRVGGNIYESSVYMDGWQSLSEACPINQPVTSTLP